MKDLISIIVPVYNTECYLDRCIQSLCNQTYKKLEIILLNDGSLDNSLAKCLEWQQKDERIIVVHKRNEKQGPTRDLGVRMASGEYFLFVDSDDWVERDYAELLYTSIYNNRSDIAFCDFDYITENENGEKVAIPRKCSVYLEQAVSIRENPGLLYSISVTLWNKIFRGGFWRKAEIIQRAGGGEDVCVCAKIISKANKLSQVRKTLYHYCYNRESTVHQPQYELEYLEPMEVIREEQIKSPLGAESGYAFKKLASSTIPYNAYSATSIKDNEKREFLRQYFIEKFKTEGEAANADSIILGSFNLRCAVREFMYMIPDSYMFSSLISLMSPKISGIRFNHVNKFRQEAVEKEMSREFLVKMSQYEYIFLDFMEERHDILEVYNQGLITKSEAFMSGTIEEEINGRVIQNGSVEYMDRWKQSCREFIGRLRQNPPGQKVILVRTRLSEWYGNYCPEKKFDTAEESVRKNIMFEKMEDYFLEYFPEAIVVENDDTKFLYTDTEYPYGCIPSHLNAYWYHQTGKLLGKQLLR